MTTVWIYVERLNRLLRGRLRAALLWLLTDDPGDEPSTAPKLNCGAFENIFGFLDSFAVVLANEAPEPNKMFLTSDEIGPVILHAVRPMGPMAKGYAQIVDVDMNLYAGQLPNLAPTPCGQLTYKPRVFCQWNTRIRETFSFSNQATNKIKLGH